MKKGATPTNYKTVVQQRLIQDIFKTPHQQDDELSEDDLLTTDQHKTFEGADNATIPLASKTSPESVTTSTPVLQRFVPRPQIPQILRHQADQSTSSATPGTPLRTPQSFSKPPIIRLVPPPSSLPAATLPIPTTSGATPLSSGTSQNFNIFNTASNLKIDKFKGDNTQNVDTWLSMYKQYCSFYDLSDKKSADSFPFHLESHAKIWYNTIPDSQIANFDNLITLFKKRFKDKQHLLDLTILQTHQGRNESVLDYLSRLYQLATNRNISDDILLAVAMNGLKPELKTIVMTKEPKNVEELRHCATLAEKAISSNTANTISQTVLEEIQTLKDQLKSINIVQDVPPQTDTSYQNHQNQFYQPPQLMPYYVPQRPYYAPQRPQNRVQQNRFQRPRLIQGQRQNYSNSQIHRPPRQSNQQRYQPVDNQFKCFYCGTNCQFKPQCPARNVICHLCNKIGHFSRVCQSSRRVPPQ